MKNKQGKFLVIDGTDGSGKTTQLNLLKEKLESEGYDVEVADFPQYNTKSAGLVEEYLSGKYGGADDVDPYQASIFYAVDRFDAKAKINYWLSAGKIVLANRYMSASLGHQGGKIDNPLERKIYFNWLHDLEFKIFEIPQPDLTIILHVESEISFKLAKNRNREDWVGKTKDIHEENINHLKKAEQTYQEIASSLPGYRLVKCTHNDEILSPEAIHFLVWLIASQIIEKKEETGKGFQAIGNIISSNKQIVDNRELILNKGNQDSPSHSKTTVIDKAADTTHNNEKASEQEIIDQIVNTSNLNQEKELTQEDKKENLVVEKIHPEAKLPKKGMPGDAGFDLYSVDYYSIPAYGQALVSTGIKMHIPDNCAGLIWGRSGLASEGITTMGGVIDCNYRGEIRVIVKNLSEDIFNIVPGQKIAQILIQKIKDLEIGEGKVDTNTERSDKSFGSTGKF